MLALDILVYDSIVYRSAVIRYIFCSMFHAVAAKECVKGEKKALMVITVEFDLYLLNH